jgi:phosphate transport system permease protein
MNKLSSNQPVTSFAGKHFGDHVFKWLTLLMAFSIFALIALIGFELFNGAKLSLHTFGSRFLTTSDWDAVNEKFGALPFIFGTLVSSAIALLIAIPISIATAVYLTELAPLWIRQPLTMFIELLAAVPSVILGLWGIFVMVPFLRDHVFPLLQKYFGFLPLFRGPIYGVSMLAGGIIVAIMIIPIITSVSREILRSVPGLQREAAYALGATRWEVNTPQIVPSLLAPGYTLASVIANEFTEATGDIYLSALFELGLVLLGVTVVVNIFAQLLLKTFTGPSVKPQN